MEKRTPHSVNRTPTVAVIIPCYNEGKTIEKSLLSWFKQTRKLDQIIVVNDGSTDNTEEVVLKYADKVTYVPQKNSGNKSFVQQTGLKYVTSDIVIATDADTLVSENFVEEVVETFKNPNIAAFAGYVQSLPNNWITACREMDYTIGQEIFKSAQDKIDYLFVIPGCAGAFRTELFKEILTFEHDTLTEDLDFTYKLHKKNMKIHFSKKAIVYTQDPNTLKSYMNQMRRWYSGGYQNLLKHLNDIDKPNASFELTLMYVEGLLFSCLFFLAPILSPYAGLYMIRFFTIYNIICGLIIAIKRKRFDVLLYSPLIIILNAINAYVFIEQFIKVVLFRKRELTWFHPERRTL